MDTVTCVSHTTALLDTDARKIFASHRVVDLFPSSNYGEKDFCWYCKKVNILYCLLKIVWS
jgi:hypothetical protein